MTYRIIILSMFLGCRTGAGHSGDLIGFLAPKLKEHGASISNPDSPIRRLSCKWKAKADEKGIQVLVEGNYFREIDNYFRSVFGKPTSQGKDPQGLPFAYYKASEIGIGLHYGLVEGPAVHVIILRKQP